MITTKHQLEEVLKRNILERDVLTTYTLGEIIDRLSNNEIAVQYYPEELEKVVPENNVLCGYVYYGEDGYLRGMDLSDGYTAKVNILKPNIGGLDAKFLILDTYGF